MHLPGPLLVLCLAVLSTIFAPRTAVAADAVPTMVIEGETRESKNAYRDERASGGQTAVTMLDKEGASGTVMSRKVTLPAGDYEAVFWLEPAPLQLLHSLSIKLQAGQVTRGATTIKFDPAPGYQPIAVRFFHPGGVCGFAVNASGKTGFDSMRVDSTVEEKSQIKNAAAAAGAKITLDGKKKKGDDLDLDLVENPPLSKLTIQDLRVACDKIEVFTRRACDVAVTDVDVEKIHYLPGETVKATAKLNGLAAGGTYQFVAELLTEADTVQKVFSKDVTLTAGKIDDLAFEFKLDPVYEFGHGLRCSIQKDGKVLHDSSEYFGVSKTVHRVGITGFSGPQNKRLMTPEFAAEVMQKNKEQYANYFECFAWAPSEYCDYTPDEELFWAGQSNFPGSISGMKNTLNEAHKRGIKGTSYSSIGAGGIGAYNAFLKFPHNFVTSDAIGMLSTYFLERAWNKEYNFASNYEQISWICWNDLWMGSGDASAMMLMDEIVNSSKQLGWDGYRWDFWPYGWIPEFKKNVEARRPGLIWGYNAVLGARQDPTTVFVPGSSTEEKDLRDACQNHGMMMDESMRAFSGPVRTLYELCANEADYIKRLGGLPLIITFSGSRLDTILNHIMALAAGERYTYDTSPGDFTFGPLPKFLTRFSAFVWDDTARIADTEKVVTIAVGRGPKDVSPWYDRTTWLRKTSDGKQQLLINLVNPPGYTSIFARTQPPPATLRDLAISVALPTGVKATRAYHVSPDLLDGLVPLTLTSDADAAKTTLPELRAWSIVVLELASTTGGELTYPALKLTTPIEDSKAEMKARGEKKLKEDAEKAQAEKIGQGDAAAAPPKKEKPTETPIYYQFDKTINADAEVAAKIKPLVDMSIRRNGVLDVHHGKGVLSWLNPIELAVGLAGGGVYSDSYTYREGRHKPSNGFMQDFPDNYPSLLTTDVLVIDNLHALDLGAPRRAKIAEYVRNGGALLYFSGFHTLSCGHDHNTALAEVLPVIQTGRENLVENNKGMPLKIEKQGFFPEGLDWSAAPVAACIEGSKLKPGVEVLISAGGHPAVVLSTFGKGKVITFLMNPHGNFAPGTLPYWKWKSYAPLLAACITRLGEGADKIYTPKPEPIVLNPKEVNPANLAIDAALLEGPEFTKRLASAQKNMIDSETAKSVLETTILNVDKVEDLALLPLIAETAANHVDVSFAPLAQKLVASRHTVFRRVGLQILGLAGNKEMRGTAESALNDNDEPTQRAALIAVGRLGNEGSIPLVRAYMKRGPHKLLAASVLRRLGDPEALARALPLYEENRFTEMASKTRRMAGAHDLWGGLGSRVSPAQYKDMLARYRHECIVEARTSFDSRYFRNSLTKFSAADIPVFAEFFSKSDTYRVSSVAYLVMGRMSPDLADQFRKSLATAANPELQLLAQK